MIYIVGYISADISGHYEESYVVEYKSDNINNITDWLQHDDVVVTNSQLNGYILANRCIMITPSGHSSAFDMVYVVNKKVFSYSSSQKFIKGKEMAIKCVDDFIRSCRNERLEQLGIKSTKS